MDESEVAARLLPPPPERVGPYRLEDRLGVGGMGAVYRAYDERLERPVAIKHILPELADDAKAWQRLRREAQTVARMNHPAVVQIYDIEEHDSGDWIVMELVDGETLFALLESGPIELPRALDLLRQVAAGLAAAHDQGIVHRDLKTENVMVTPDDRVKILDFGLAKNLWRGAEASLSIEGAILGTGRSMSPEQALGDEVTRRSDLFSLGTLIYEVVTGEPPFTGSSVFRILAQVCSDPHPPPREVNPELPEDLAALIDRLLEKDPQKRPASAAEVLEALNAIRLPSPGAESSAASPRTGTGGAGGRQPAPPTPPWQRSPPDSSAEDTLWMHPVRRPGRRRESSSGLHIRTLLRITLKPRAAEPGGSRGQLIASRHDRLVRDLLANSGGLEIDKLDDGFMLLFELPSEAVAYALSYMRRLADFRREEGVEIRAGVGVHLGEMHMTENLPADVSRGAKLLEVAGPAKRIAARAAALAGEGQILMTQMAYELARRALAGDDQEIELDWVAHGRYRLRDVDEAQAIYAVGPRGETLAAPPADSETAERLPQERDARETVIGSRRRHWIPWSLTAVAFLSLGLWWLSSSESPGPAAGQRRATVAVLGFKNLSERVEVDWLSTALSELFTAELAAGGGLRLIAGEAVARMKHELSLPAAEMLATDTLGDIRRNLGTEYVLVGSFLALEREGESLRLNLRLQPTDGGEATFYHATGRESELFELVSGAALGLRQELGLEMISSADAAAVKATLGASPEANRLYSEGLAGLRAHDALGARDLLQQAVAADPDYALAHGALSRAWSQLGYDDKARDGARRALELGKDLPGASFLAIQGRFHEVMGQWDKAVDTYQLLRELHPDDVDFALRQVEAQQRAGRGREALATLESLRGLPAHASGDPRVDLAEAAVRASQSDYQGSIDSAEHAIRKGTEKEAWILVAEAQLRKWRPLRSLGRRDEAGAALEQARRLFAAAGDRAKVADALSGIALLLEDQGRLSQAERLYRQALDIHRQIGNQKGVADGLNNLADLILDLGELEAAKTMVAQAMAVAREIGDLEREAKCLDTTAWVQLRLGNLAEADARARESLAMFEQIGQPEGVGWGHYYLGQVALARGEVSEAERRYRQALEISREIDSNNLSSFALHSLAEVRLIQGDLDAAKRAAADSTSLPSELTPGESELLRCRLLLESGEHSAAAGAAQAVARDLRAEDRRGGEAEALVALALARLALGDAAAARSAIELARAAAEGSRNPRLRLSVELAGGRIDAAGGDPAGGRRQLESVLGEAGRRGLAGLELEARLALAELDASAGAAGPERLEALAADARARGFGLVARKAAALRDRF